MQVGELFELRNTTVGKLGELSLARVRPVDASADAVVEISHLVMRHYEEGALIVDPFFLEGRSSFTGIVIDRPCDCDMFKVATNASLHHTAETTGVTEEISNLIKCKRKLRSRSKVSLLYSMSVSTFHHVLLNSRWLYTYIYYVKRQCGIVLLSNHFYGYLQGGFAPRTFLYVVLYAMRISSF